ncbi:hypothetical protein BDW02DRAFT_385097 [Decorospora gaudefroyi]|uniref:Uncharacterized protein n=1 Tax=Decorospora gaudefroyi TaxID=184978 RepID=A0A6A5KBL7_9PLEO|nr:hypothetical protein BDW02DRAFT_385097 [Decorospora gaudefroyi]
MSGLLSWSASTILCPQRTKDGEERQKRRLSHSLGRPVAGERADLLHAVAVRRLASAQRVTVGRRRSPRERISEAGALPVSQSRPDKSRVGLGAGQCLFRVQRGVDTACSSSGLGPWTLSCWQVPCELYDQHLSLWARPRPLSPGDRGRGLRLGGSVESSIAEARTHRSEA